MPELLTVSLIWAFSFGMIGNILKGVDPCLLATARLLISFLVFLPLLRIKHLSIQNIAALAGIGAIQYGFMYISLFMAYQYLESHEVALFTIFTPIYVTLVNDISTKRFHRLFLATALLAVIGTGVIKSTQLHRDGLIYGFLIMQFSNLCFAGGQIFYRSTMRNIRGVKDSQVFAVLYAGAVAVAAPFALITTSWTDVSLDARQIAVLLYLGAVASGLAFFLWNSGARKVNAGTLAIFNNLKVPLAITVSLLIFKEQTNLPRLLVGGLLVLAALAINELYVRTVKRKTQSPNTENI